MSQSSLLFLTTQLPYPPESGGTIKSFRLLECFAKHFEVNLFTLLKQGDAEYEEELKEHVNLACYYSKELFISRTLLNYLNCLLSRKTLNEYRNYNLDFQSKVEQISPDVDMIFVDHLEMFQYVPRSFKGNVILHEHNAEWLIWKRFSNVEQHILKANLLKYESSRIRKKEISYCKKSDMVFASPNDYDQLQKNGVEENILRKTLHLGNDSLLQLDDLEFDQLPNDLVFMGTLSWEANVDGLIFFLEDIYPLILEKNKHIKLNVVGRDPDSRLSLAAKKFGDNVVFHGFVRDIETVFNLGKVFILPLRFGSGMKVKFLDALYRGMPIVSTSIGAEGISVVPNSEAAICDDPEAFATSCIRLLQNKSDWENMSRAQKKLAKHKYTWPTLLSKMVEEIKTIA